MKHFKILWFEDNIVNFDRIIPKIESHVQRNNHLFLYDLYDHYPADFNTMLFDGIYSLAFIDLNLKNGQKGIEIINILRERGAYIDILLYSNNAAELISLTEANNYVEGIFRHATMNGIGDKMNDVVDQIIYKETMTIKRHDENSENK